MPCAQQTKSWFVLLQKMVINHHKSYSAASTYHQRLNTFTLLHVLDNALQGQHYLPKWQKRALLGVYLGPFPNHSRTVHLILNPTTGHVMPQYHVKHDDFFETVSNKNSNFDSPEPEWKRFSGLVKNSHK